MNHFTGILVRSVTLQKRKLPILSWKLPFIWNSAASRPVTRAGALLDQRSAGMCFGRYNEQYSIMKDYILTNDDHYKQPGAIRLRGWWSHLADSPCVCFISSCLSNPVWSLRVRGSFRKLGRKWQIVSYEMILQQTRHKYRSLSSSAFICDRGDLFEAVYVS